ncbi:hypothetical protein BDW71DRAFT_213696 [Aspergillus fruticulosus]
MRMHSILVAITSYFPSTLGQQTTGCADPSSLCPIPHQQTAMDNPRGVSCHTNPPESITDRTRFGVRGCIVYGYPSTGGVLIKGPIDLVDITFLSLPRFHVAQRSPSAEEEDRFCNLLRRLGATWWPSKEEYIMVNMGSREKTEEEEKVLVPRDIGRMYYAANMEERIQIMKEYGAEFVEDVSQVEELRDTL